MFSSRTDHFKQTISHNNPLIIWLCKGFEFLVKTEFLKASRNCGTVFLFTVALQSKVAVSPLVTVGGTESSRGTGLSLV